jgi:hypothetical protein
MMATKPVDFRKGMEGLPEEQMLLGFEDVQKVAA